MAQIAMGESNDSLNVDTPSSDAPVERGLHATYQYEGQKEITNPQIAAIFQSIMENDNRYRDRFMPEMTKAYLQYHGDNTDRGKAEWQSNVNIPLPHEAVATSTARIVDSLFSNDDFFDIMPYVRVDDAKVALAKSVIKWNLWRSDARSRIGTSVSDALICGFGPMKVYYSEFLEERTEVNTTIVPRSPEDSWFGRATNAILGPSYTTEKNFVTANFYTNKLRFDPLLPTDVWLDASGRGEHIIQRVKRRVSDLWDLCKDQKDSSGQVRIPKVYDAEEVRKITTGSNDPTDEARAAVIRRDTPHLYESGDIDVYEFWGDFRDPSNGVVLFKNCLITIVGKQWVIRRPQTNPYRHRKFPFVVFTCADEPHQVYPYGILKQASLLQDAVNRHWNITLDKQMLNCPQLEAFPGACRNPNELMGANASFKVGKIYLRKNEDKAIFYPMEGFPPVTQEDFELLHELEQRVTSSYGLSEFNSALVPATGDRKTKEEASAKTQAGQAVFNAAATHIEKSAITPLLKMVYELTLQYESKFSDETLSKMVGENGDAIALLQQMRAMSPEEIWESMYLDAEFRCIGISLNITRQDRLNRIMGYMKIAGASPVLQALVDMNVVNREILQNMDLPKTIMMPNSDQVIAQIQQAQVQNLLQPPQPQGGQPGQPQQGGMPGENQYNSQEKAVAQAHNAPQSQVPQ